MRIIHIYKLTVDGQSYVAQFSMKNEVALLTWEQFTAHDPKAKKARG